MNTPAATPVVPAPDSRGINAPREAKSPALLKAPISVITPGGELDLERGSITVGRLPQCEIFMNDALVSRMHARITVEGESVIVEDLHSTNGVYVNGLRIAHNAILREGDRILIGTTELSLFENRDASIMRLRRADPECGPPARAEVKDATSAVRLRTLATKNSLPNTVVQEPPPASRKLEGIPATARADGLSIIGNLADRLAATGNLEEAASLLSGHLKRILQGANAGLAVTPEVAALASHHALNLARWTKSSRWTDYVVELHLSARLVMSSSTLTSFESALARVESTDQLLLRYYVDGLVERRAACGPEELRRVERLQQLVGPA